MAGRIDFAQLAAALLSAAERLVPAWLPEGHREGHEWRCGGLSGRAGSTRTCRRPGGRSRNPGPCCRSRQNGLMRLP